MRDAIAIDLTRSRVCPCKRPRIEDMSATPSAGAGGAGLAGSACCACYSGAGGASSSRCDWPGSGWAGGDGSVHAGRTVGADDASAAAVLLGMAPCSVGTALACGRVHQRAKPAGLL